MNFAIRNALVPQSLSYEKIDVEVIANRIGAIRPSEPFRETSYPVSVDAVSIDAVIDGRDKLLIAGFVNGHTHSSQIWQRGLISQLPLELWLADLFDSTPTNLEHFYLGAVSTAVDTILSGGTCVVDHAYLASGQELETVAALVKGYTEVGIRAVIAPLIQDLPFVAGLPAGMSLPHTPYPRSTAEILELMEAIIRQFHQPEAGIYIGLGPTGFHRCSDQLLEGCATLSDRYNLCCHSHLLETKAQKRLAQERYGRSGVEHLQQLGFLNERTSLAHGVWLSDQDIEILAATRSTVVHNPVSNLRLGSGIAPILKCLQAGVNVAFGCDGAASNDAQNLLEAIKLGTILHTVSDPDYRSWLTPHTALTMAALGGAKGINLADQIGSLTPGKQADLVLYDLQHPAFLPCTDPVQLLVLGRPTDVVDYVWVNGKLIVEQGKVVTVDVSHLRQELQARNRGKNRPKFQTIHQIEPHYRKQIC